MKALSIRQPWAWMILHAGKRIENRSWNTGFRGEFYIHASKGATLGEHAEAIDFARRAIARTPEAERPAECMLPALKDLDRGGIIGTARLVDVVAPCGRSLCEHPWHIRGQYGFVIEDARPLPFRPLRGMLGFFEVPDA